MKHTDLLNVFPSFRCLSAQEWEMAKPNIRKYPARTCFFEQKDAEVYSMFLLSGTAQITLIKENGEELACNTLSAGEVCGFLTLSGLSSRDYPGSILSISDVVVLYVQKSSFLTWLLHHPPIRQTVFGGLFTGMLRMSEHLHHRHEEPVEERIAKLLLNRSTEQHPLVTLTHQELALEIHTAREVASRTLQRFRKAGWIETGRGQIKIIHRKKLEDLCD
ncbi:Crp/Fnr family transcriptional regulator [Shimazuella kribbensis]|uniref:Crp/Fnr family transcriptional regulator n=1 Tax=Shimazuella kribbensis TaxID=139808 RepID=UPI0003FCD1B1|nr:Crp/Fnr family transcriptional regulator [Shimazuella kribbensis]